MSTPQLRLEDLPLVIRENFLKIQQFLRDNQNLGNFTHFEFTFTKAVTALKIPHRLGFQPKDILQTSLTGSGAITWLYAQFDVNFIVVTTTGPCVVRAYIGTETQGVVA